MGCGSSTEVRAITPESRPHYNNNDNSNKPRQQHQQQQVQQHPNSVEHELREKQEQQAMLLKQQEEQQQAMLLKQQEEQKAMLFKQQQEQQRAMLLKQQEEQQAMLLKQQEEQQKALLQQQQEAALLMQQQQAQQNQEQDNNPNNHTETQPDSDSLGEGSAPEETLEQARQRLAVYGQYDEGYTVRQVSDINQEKGQSVLFIWAKIVHLTAAFKDIIEPEVAARQAEREQDCSGLFDDDMVYLREKSSIHPVIIAKQIGIKMSTILKYVSKCKVATLVILNNKEFWSDIRSDADRVAMDIKSDGNVSAYLTEYLEVLERFFELFARLDGDIPLSPSKSDGDPNMLSFPLPNSVAADPGSIRRWAEAWEVFDFVVPEDGAWGWYGFENLVFTDINECVDFPQLLRGDEELLEFDTKVEGEAAWDVIEVDLFKDDVTTEEQDLIWEEREKRSDFDSPERMKKRREKIEQYFIIKYEWESSALDAYRGWADALEAGWQNFQKLCES